MKMYIQRALALKVCATSYTQQLHHKRMNFAFGELLNIPTMCDNFVNF